MVQILMPENIPAENKGEAAILLGILESLKKLCSVRFIVFSENFESDHQRYKGYGIEVVDAQKLSPGKRKTGVFGNLMYFWSVLLFIFKHATFLLFYRILGSTVLRVFKSPIWKSYVGSDLIMLAHDNAFSVSYHLPMISFVKMLNLPVVVIAASFRASSSRLMRYLTKRCLQKVDLILLREEISFRAIEGIVGDGPQIRVTADPAFIMPSASEAVVANIMHGEGIANEQGPLIGITLNRLMARRAFLQTAKLEDREGSFVIFMAKLIDFLIEEHNSTVVFVPHCVGPDNETDDRRMARDIFESIKNRRGVNLIDNEYKPEEIKGIIGSLDLLIGQRLHSMIDAASMNVPLIGISYPADYRTYGIIGEMLGLNEWLLNIEDITLENVKDRIEKALKEDKRIRMMLQDRVATVKEAALQNGQFIENLLFGDA